MPRMQTLAIVIPLALAACAETDPQTTDETTADTGTPGDTTAPTVLGFEPADGAVRVPVAADIRIEFSEPVTEASAALAVQLVDDAGAIALDVSAGTGNELVFTPTSLLDGETEYTVTVGTELEDLAGNPLDATLTFDFTTADVDAPWVTNSVPAHKTLNVDIDVGVVLTFSEDIDPKSVDATTVVLFPYTSVDGIAYSGPTGLDATYAVTGNQIEITPTRGSLQEYETDYDLIIDGVQDLAGNESAAQTISFSSVLLDNDYHYRIFNVQFETVLDTYSDSRTTYLADPSALTSGSFWYATGVNGDMRLHNAFLGDNWYLEGGKPGSESLMTKGGFFTGQIWTASYSYGGAVRAGAAAFESPFEFWLENANTGTGVSLGVFGKNSVGLETAVAADQAWYFRNDGLRP